MTTPTSSAKNEGLRDIVASPSNICFIDGDKGILVYAGYNIHDLAVNSTFEETVFLLWNTRLPRREELARFDAELRANRELPSGVIDLIRTFPTNIVPMDALRTGFSALAAYDPDRHDSSPAANQRKAIRMTAQCATLVAAIDRIRNGNEPLAPPASNDPPTERRSAVPVAPDDSRKCDCRIAAAARRASPATASTELADTPRSPSSTEPENGSATEPMAPIEPMPPETPVGDEAPVVAPAPEPAPAPAAEPAPGPAAEPAGTPQ